MFGRWIARLSTLGAKLFWDDVALRCLTDRKQLAPMARNGANMPVTDSNGSERSRDRLSLAAIQAEVQDLQLDTAPDKISLVGDSSIDSVEGETYMNFAVNMDNIELGNTQIKRNVTRRAGKVVGVSYGLQVTAAVEVPTGKITVKTPAGPMAFEIQPRSMYGTKRYITFDLTIPAQDMLRILQATPKATGATPEVPTGNIEAVKVPA